MREQERSSVAEEIRKIDPTIPIVCVCSNGQRAPEWANCTIKETDSPEVVLESISSCLGQSRKAA